MTESDPMLEAISELLPQLLASLRTLQSVARRLHPPQLALVIEDSNLRAIDQQLQQRLQSFYQIQWPPHLQTFSQQLVLACRAASAACVELVAAPAQSQPLTAAYRALGSYAQALETLYPLAQLFEPVNRFFINEHYLQHRALFDKLAAVDHTRPHCGVIHAENNLEQRGGFSLYVPEYYHELSAMPVIMALHGAGGHGRQFLWSWLREARTRGAILICPSSIGASWSLSGDDCDSPNIAAILDSVGQRWPLDKRRLLLTGISDGGTFCYVNGLLASSPFTHIAPIAASFHPLLLAFTDRARLHNLPVYLTHGELDWMFPIAVAKAAYHSLKDAGAAVHYRAIADLSHCSPVEENSNIIDWLTTTECNQ